MITLLEMCQVYHSRYKINAIEARQSALLDREILNNKEDQHHLRSIESFDNYLEEMESLGA